MAIALYRSAAACGPGIGNRPAKDVPVPPPATVGEPGNHVETDESHIPGGAVSGGAGGGVFFTGDGQAGLHEFFAEGGERDPPVLEFAATTCVFQ